MLKKLRSRISTTKTSESILEALEIKMMFLLRKCPDLAKPARLLLWLAAISMTAVFAANWEPMNVVDLPDTSGKKFYVTFMDRSSLQKTGNLRSIWILTNYLEVQSFRGIKDGEVDFIKYRSAKSLVYFDCQQKKWRRPVMNATQAKWAAANVSTPVSTRNRARNFNGTKLTFLKRLVVE